MFPKSIILRSNLLFNKEYIWTSVQMTCIFKQITQQINSDRTQVLRNEKVRVVRAYNDIYPNSQQYHT